MTSEWEKVQKSYRRGGVEVEGREELDKDQKRRLNEMKKQREKEVEEKDRQYYEKTSHFRTLKDAGPPPSQRTYFDERQRKKEQDHKNKERALGSSNPMIAKKAPENYKAQSGHGWGGLDKELSRDSRPNYQPAPRSESPKYEKDDPARNTVVAAKPRAGAAPAKPRETKTPYDRTRNRLLMEDFIYKDAKGVHQYADILEGINIVMEELHFEDDDSFRYTMYAGKEGEKKSAMKKVIMWRGTFEVSKDGKEVKLKFDDSGEGNKKIFKKKKSNYSTMTWPGDQCLHSSKDKNAVFA